MNRNLHMGLSIVASGLLLTSCVSSKKFKASQAALESARSDSASLAGRVAEQEASIGQLKQ
jgi:chemotaxis protein MotB